MQEDIHASSVLYLKSLLSTGYNSVTSRQVNSFYILGYLALNIVLKIKLRQLIFIVFLIH